MHIPAPAPIAADRAPTLPARPRPAPTPRRRIDPLELGLLGVLAAISMWIVASDLVVAAQHHLVWTHTDGFFIVDQMQYLAWIQSAAQHGGLISNLFVLRSSPADYLQPAIAVSAGLLKLGLAPWLTLLVWKPVAVVSFFAAVRAAAHHFFVRRVDRVVALTLALLFGSLSVIYGKLGIVGDMMPTWSSWGYPFGLIAVALVVFGLLRYDRARTAGRIAWGPGLLGALAGSLHPWQGEMMILIVAGAELARATQILRGRRAANRARPGRRRPADLRLGLPVVTIALTLAPLVYYLALGHLDINWDMARQSSKHEFPFWAIAMGAAPLAVFAALGYRRRPTDFFELSMRVWVPAALVIYVLSATALSATPLHAFDGITIPLALLAVKGVRQTGLARIARGRLLAGAAVLLGTVPANVYAMAYAHTYTAPAFANANYISSDELRALRYLADDPTSGGVLTQFYLGEVVPGFTGRQVFVGDCLWTEPRCLPRSEAADRFFQGQMSKAATRRFARQSGARFVLASCDDHVDLGRRLGSMVIATRRFGCATVSELDAPSSPTGPFVSVRRHRRA